MSEPLVIRVCESCAWEKKKIRYALKEIRDEHGSRVKIVKKDCLDECGDGPIVIVGKRLIEEARPRDVKAAVNARLN